MTAMRSPAQKRGVGVIVLPLLITMSSVTVGCQSRAVPIEDSLCQQYARLKNAGDPAADDLLEPAPDADVTVIDAANKDAFDAAWILRAPWEILEVRNDESRAGRFVLVLHGGATTPKVAVVKKGVIEEPSQRTLMNPDVVVEVRDGKIVPIKARVHKD